MPNDDYTPDELHALISRVAAVSLGRDDRLAGAAHALFEIIRVVVGRLEADRPGTARWLQEAIRIEPPPSVRGEAAQKAWGEWIEVFHDGVLRSLREGATTEKRKGFTP